MVKVLVVLTGDTSCHGQGLCSAVYSLVSMHHGMVGCIFVVNGDMHLLRELGEIIVPGHGQVNFWLIKYLELHDIILRAKQFELEVRHENTSALKD